jgi:hypothetical protein
MDLPILILSTLYGEAVITFINTDMDIQDHKPAYSAAQSHI